MGIGRRARIGALVTLAIIVGLVILIRLLLDPLAAHYTRLGLNKSDSTRGDFDRVHVTVFPPGYEIRRLKIVERRDVHWREPLFYAERVTATLDPHRLLHRELAVRVRVDEPKIIVTSRPGPSGKAAAGPPDLAPMLRQILPARMDRLEVRNGEFLFRDLAMPRDPEIWVHKIELAAENLATRRQLQGGQPTTLAASAELGRSGRVTLFVSTDPFARPLAFAGRLEERGWRVSELYDLLEPPTKLQAPKGTLDVFAAWKSEDGRISGAVKPLLKDVQVKPTDEGFGDKLKAWLVDTGLHLFSDRVPGRNAVATVVPIEGRLTDPNFQIWPTVFGVVRNAFVEGVASSFRRVPPDKAENKQGVISQAKTAVEKKAGPPKAQPSK
ncbi:MAG TPA: DUF748 domain-containing protein [Polyangia bacterium]